MASKDKKRGLGRGLSALMADVGEAEAQTPMVGRTPDQLIPIEQIRPNPDQPRKQFDQAQLDDLVAAI